MSGLEELEALGGHVAEREEGLTPSPVEHERLRAAVVERAFAPRATGFGPRWTAGLAAAAAVLIAVTIFLLRRSPAPLSFYVGPSEVRGTVGSWMSAPEGSPLPIRFSDGTRSSLLAKGRARVVSVSPFGANVVVESGSARFDVVPRPNGEWSVNTGPYVVHVTGTRFQVEWHADRDAFVLELYEGHVRVSGCDLDEPYPVRAGERVEASCGRNEFRVAPIEEQKRTDAEPGSGVLAGRSGATAAGDTSGGESSGLALPSPGPGVGSDSRPAAPVVSTASHARSALANASAGASRSSLPGAAADFPAAGSPSAAPSSADVENRWIDLAKRGLYVDAFAAVEERGFDGERERRSAADVTLLGDVARFSGHPDRARLAYQSVRQRFPGTPSAALAAFQLGRDDFDRQSDYAGAERWLRMYLDEAPSGALAPAAMGRLMEAEVRQGHRDAAQQLAASYLERFPKGPHADAAHRLLGAAAGDLQP